MARHRKLKAVVNPVEKAKAVIGDYLKWSQVGLDQASQKYIENIKSFRKSPERVRSALERQMAWQVAIHNPEVRMGISNAVQNAKSLMANILNQVQGGQTVNVENAPTVIQESLGKDVAKLIGS